MAEFSLFCCRQMLTSQMGVVVPNGGVHMSMAFVGPKIALLPQ